MPATMGRRQSGRELAGLGGSGLSFCGGPRAAEADSRPTRMARGQAKQVEIRWRCQSRTRVCWATPRSSRPRRRSGPRRRSAPAGRREAGAGGLDAAAGSAGSPQAWRGSRAAVAVEVCAAGPGLRQQWFCDQLQHANAEQRRLSLLELCPSYVQ
eukprot:SRR837773.13622.p3 GENE.SRR837773.13622~~SRR837773.13622.p3  ORF type:complete len:155 (-),score=2.51 SRR837773.13622:70-534(-)